MIEKPKTYNGDLANLPPALLPLTMENRCVVWRWELVRNEDGTEKWTKVPYQAPYYNEHAKANDPSTWGAYVDAVATVLAGHADGIGFMLKGSTIGAADLDHVRNAETGAIISWAEQIRTESNGAYCEVTVSGTGLRIIGNATGPEIHRKFKFDRAGIEIFRDAGRFITVSGLEVGACRELPSSDPFLDTLLARYDGIEDKCKARQGNGFDFNDAGPQPATDTNYEDIIKNGAPQGQRSDLFQVVIWHLANKGWTAEQIAEELAKHPNGIGQKYAKRLLTEVQRSYKKWQQQRQAAATGGTAANNPWPQIRVISGELPRVVNEAEEALLTCGREIYQRGGLLVRPGLSDLKSWYLIQVSLPYMIETLTCAARFLRYDKRSKGFVPMDAPYRVAQALLSREAGWRLLPVLSGIVNTPFLRMDGSICEQPGYDTASRLLLKCDAGYFSQIPQHPSREDALKAIGLLKELISTFPFVTEADQSVALSAILTALDRRSMMTAPLHAFTAPVAGTGKSLLVDAVSMIATGRPLSVISQGHNDEELGKRLGAALLAGDTMISIDNCGRILESDFLCQALTQQQLKIRVLGFSRNVETPTNAAFFATGNNLTIAGDLNRRTLLCSMDAKEEHPERRKFTTNLMRVVRENRAALVTATLTVLRAWHIAEERVDEALLLGSFEEWSCRIRAPLVWLGCPDPCDTMEKIKDEDPQRSALSVVLLQWKAILGVYPQVYTVQEVINRSVNAPEFYAALLDVASNYGGSLVNSRRFGRWLKQVEGKIVDGLALQQTGSRNGYPLWSVN